MSLKAHIPNSLTLCNLACGTAAVLLTDIFWSPMLILIAGVFDLLDGAVARALGVTSPIGKELDSLCDMVSFGLAPAMLYWLLVPNESYLWFFVPVMLTAAAAWRLAKFNTLEPSTHFLGMATPASALALAGITLGVYWGNPILTLAVGSPWSYALIALFLAWSMNRSRIMLSMKGWKDDSDRNWLIGIGLGAALIFAWDYTLGLPFAILWYWILCEIKALISHS